MTDAEILAYIRLRLGSVPEEYVSDVTIQTFLTLNKNRFTSDGELIYHTTINVVEFIIAKETLEGDASRVMSMEGGVLHDITGLSYVDSWVKWLTKFRRNPQLVGVDGFSPNSNPVLIGGVRKSEIDNVRNDSNSGYMYDIPSIYND